MKKKIVKKTKFDAKKHVAELNKAKERMEILKKERENIDRMEKIIMKKQKIKAVSEMASSTLAIVLKLVIFYWGVNVVADAVIRIVNAFYI